MPLFRRLPKRGFNNKNFAKVFTTVNVSDLQVFDDGAVVDLQAVLDKGLTSKEKGSKLFKLLGDGPLTKKPTVKVDALTTSAQQKVEAAGGSVELIPQRTMRPKFIRKDGTRSVKRSTVAAESAADSAAAPATENKTSDPTPEGGAS